jgi:hypothetical protein
LDDAEERISGNITFNSSDLELVFDAGGDQTVGLRFTSVNIPNGADISSAYIQFQANETNSEATSLIIEGEDTDNAEMFVPISWGISSRPRTAASTSWSPAPWLQSGEAGIDQQTPNIASVIEEIVNRPGWSSGISLVIIITGTGERVAESFDGAQVAAPLLHVEFMVDESNTAPVAVDDGPYTTDEQTQLDVAAPGVLGNDTDSDGDPLKAVLDTSSSDGLLVLNDDGSFSYTPDAGFSGNDTFTYHANDGRTNSNIATVTIAVVVPCEGDIEPPGVPDKDVVGSGLAIFAADFGRADCSNDCEGDFDGDDDVDENDLTIFAADFGRTNCPQ